MIIFSIREGWRNFTNLGLIGLLCLVSLTVTLTLFGLTVRSYFLVEEWKSGLLGRFEIEAFLKEDTDSLSALTLLGRIKLLTDVDEVRYISKTAAAERFSEQFGEDLFELLEFNPLPASLVVTLEEDADPSHSWGRIAGLIEGMEGVDDVVYEGKLLAAVNRFYRTTGAGVMAAVGVTLIVSVILTILAVQSAIRSKEEFIRIVLLCGGTGLMARGPFIALGGYYGIISGLVASGVMALVGLFIVMGWGIGSVLPPVWIPAQAALGCLVGMIGAGWAAGRRK